MGFQTRQEFIKAQASEKITLAHVEATRRLVNWSNYSGNTYVKTVPYYTVGLFNGISQLTEVSSIGNIVTNSWYYDHLTSQIYLNVADSDPFNYEIIVRYRLFFSNAPVVASHDLTDSGNHVRYQGRARQAPSFKHKVGVEQKLISVVGSGKLVLENTDGGLDTIYDKLFFENKEVRIYSWTRGLQFSDAKIIYRGRITNKSYSNDEVTFTVKDLMFDLLQDVQQEAFTLADGVTESVVGRYKRWLYGRIEGLKLQSISQIGEGFQITGTVSGTVDSDIITGNGTQFLSELSPDDTLNVGTQEFTITAILSDTQAQVGDSPEFAFTNLTATLVPEIPPSTFNREYIVAGHACTRLSKTVAAVIQFNRVQLSDTNGLEAGDFISFSTGERIEIKNIAPNNIVVLRQNVVLIPLVGSTVTREPVQQIFVRGKKVTAENFTLSNTTGGCFITLDTDVEFNIARAQSLGVDMTFTNGSRTVTTGSDKNLSEILSPRDFIRPSDLSYTTYYEILSVGESSLELRVAFADPTHTGPTTGKLPDYISDDTIITADVLGRTEDGTPDGTWISTAPAAIRDLLVSLNITEYNNASFEQGKLDSKQTISLAIPSSPSGGSESVKSVVDKLTQSVIAAVTLDNDLKLKYKTLLPEIDLDAPTIRDEDVVSWSIKSVNGDNIRKSLIRYRHQDINRYTQESGYLIETYSNEFVEKYIGTNAGDEFDLYLYKQRDAKIASHRYPYIRSLARADLTLETDLRFENVEIGDQVILDLKKLYTRFGADNVRKKVCIVVGKEVNGESMIIYLTDMGNIYNRSSIITPNDASDYDAASVDERILYGYITDSRGIIDDDEDSANINLIS